MRYAFVIAAAALCAGTAFAEEPAACYIAKDPTGDFTPEKIQALDADPRIDAQVRHLLNESNYATGKCLQRYARREGGLTSGGGVMYGARISPSGKVTQVSVLAIRNINDAMFMACIARTICEWQLEASADGQERIVALPPYAMSERFWNKTGR
jgi:hypothetical protein